MKRTGAVGLIALLLVFISATAAPAQNGQPSPPQVNAAAGILIDVADGKALWEKHADARRSPASLTKVLTALVALEKTKPSQRITASARAEAVGADDPLVTELELVAGEKLTSEQLLYGLLLPSANDAAYAFAEGISGSLSKFSALMNDTARNLGARNTNFVDPAGFDTARHYSTARDLATIAREAMRNPVFRKIVGTPRYVLNRPGRPPQELLNRNTLLGSLAGANGIKTGQTRQAGKTLIASARRGGEERIAVVLDSPDPAAETSALLNYGFTAFRRFEAARTGVPWGVLTFGNGSTATLVARGDLSFLVEASAPDPEVTYVPAKRMIETGGERVPVAVECNGPACGPKKSRGRFAGSLLYLFSPLLALLR